MNVFRNSRTITCVTAVIAILAATAIFTAEGAAERKSAYEKRIDKIMDDYVTAIRSVENSFDKKLAPVTKSLRARRNAAVAKAGQVLLAKLDRAARHAKRMKWVSEVTLAEAKLAEFKKHVEQLKTAHPVRPAAADKPKPAPREQVMASHVTYRGHRYLAIMGKCTLYKARDVCRKLGGHLVYLDSAQEMSFLQSEMPCKFTLWVGAADTNGKDNWIWLNGKRLNPKYWANGWPKRSCTRLEAKTRKDGISHVRAALHSSGLLSRSEKETCKGFICEWDR